jgi:hypothetical protein
MRAQPSDHDDAFVKMIDVQHGCYAGEIASCESPEQNSLTAFSILNYQ